MARVVTDEGTTVLDNAQLIAKEDRPLTTEEAEADAARRNERAEKLGIKTRYEVRD